MELDYSYDTNGALINLSSSPTNGATVNYGYDALGRPSTVTAGGVTAAAYRYDGVDNLASARFGNNVTNFYQYDARNRLTSLTNLVHRVNTVTLAAFLYLLDPTGLRTNLAEVINGAAATRGWTYDSLRRLTQESWSGATNGPVTYAFDHVGNRTTRTTTSTNQTYSYSANDWLTTDAYDNAGNTTNSSGVAYTYDPMNRLIAADNGAVTFGHEGDGNRVWKNANGVATHYLVDDRNPSGYAQVVYEASTDDSSIAHVYGLDLVSQACAPAGGGFGGLPAVVSYFGHDGQGSVRFLTDTNGTVTDTYTYDAYGIQVASTGAGTVNHYLYTGQQWNGDLGMYYLRARYYQPNTGRFWTMDTGEGENEDPLSFHKYLYCQGDPVNGIDPSGLRFSQGFGEMAHALIAGRSLVEHPGTIINPTRGVLGEYKPDIVNGPARVYAEIKPLSFPGITEGFRMKAYDGAFQKLGFTRETRWPVGFGYFQVAEDPFVYFNVNGLIFYTDAVDYIEEGAP